MATYLVHHACCASPEEAPEFVAGAPVDCDGLSVKAIDLPIQRFHLPWVLVLLLFDDRSSNFLPILAGVPASNHARQSFGSLRPPR